MRGSDAIEFEGKQGSCFYCGEPVFRGAMWRGLGGEPVYVCSECAEFNCQPLAALIADAIADQPRLDTACYRLMLTLQRLEGEAWRSLALALERKGRE